MTISTYSELKTAIANYTHRSDLTSRDDEAIDNFEAKVSRRLRVRGLEASATGNTVSGTATISIPTAFVEVRTLTYVPATGSVRKLEYITPEQAEAKEYSSNGQPRWYTFLGGAIALYPTPDAAYAYTIKYYRSIVPLDGTNTTNWLLTSHPDAYLAGCLVEMCLFSGDFEGMAHWRGMLEEVLRQIERADRRERFVSPVVQFDAELMGVGMSRNIETDGE